jgi:hypothetical protein
MTSEDTDTTSEYIDKFLLDYFREEINPVITTANMMEDLMLLEDKEPKQTEKYPKTSVGGSDPVLGAQTFEKISLEEKIVKTSVGGQQTEKYPQTSVEGSDSVLYEQNVDNFLLEDQIEKEAFVNGLSDKNGSLPGSGLISPLSSPLEPASLSQHVPHLELIDAMTTSTDFPISANAEPTLPQTLPHPIDALRAARALARTNETTNWDPQEADFPAWSNSRSLVSTTQKAVEDFQRLTTHPIVPPRSRTQACFLLHSTPSRKSIFTK